jgi:hypothetical protein
LPQAADERRAFGANRCAGQGLAAASWYESALLAPKQIPHNERYFG